MERPESQKHDQNLLRCWASAFSQRLRWNSPATLLAWYGTQNCTMSAMLVLPYGWPWKLPNHRLWQATHMYVHQMFIVDTIWISKLSVKKHSKLHVFIHTSPNMSPYFHSFSQCFPMKKMGSFAPGGGHWLQLLGLNQPSNAICGWICRSQEQ